MELFVAIVLVLLAGVVLPPLIRYFLKERYFASAEFQAHKARVASFVGEHNEVAKYLAEMRSRGSFMLGTSVTGSQAHLASYENTSHWNYRRDRNVANYQAPSVHNCSLQVVRNASADPIKYTMKYFGIKAEEAHLADVEKLGEDIAQLEDAVHNLKRREDSIAQSVRPPAFIMKYYAGEFMKHVGVELSPISVPYPVYVFEYVSAGETAGSEQLLPLTPRPSTLLLRPYRRGSVGRRALLGSGL